MPKIVKCEVRPLKNAACYSRQGKELSSFYSEGEAWGAAEASKAHGLNLIPYECTKCGYWHLSPKSRQTPSSECGFCGKQLYETKAAAEKRAKILGMENGVKLYIYKCPCFNGYHLTQKDNTKAKR